MLQSWLRFLPKPSSNASAKPAPRRLLLLASASAAAGWLAETLQRHPHWSGAVVSPPGAATPQAGAAAAGGCRAVLVLRHPALEAIEARLQGWPDSPGTTGSTGAAGSPAAVKQWRAWQDCLGRDLLVVTVASLVEGRHPRALRRICRHLQLPGKAAGWDPDGQAPPPYRHGLPADSGWQFAGDGLRRGPGARTALGGAALAALLQVADAELEAQLEAHLLPAAEQCRWHRISQALAAYAVTSGQGRPSFWISAEEQDDALAAGVIGGRSAAGSEQALAARLGRTARFSRFEPPLRLYATSLEGACRIGAFSYVVDSFLYGTHVGRYCSIGRACEIGQHDHPTAWLSTHPFQYSKAIGFAAPGFAFSALAERAEPGEARWRQFTAAVGYRRHTQIGHDVWIGARVFVKKGVRVGNGAVIGAGSVVTRDVPAYAIAAGSPARVLRYRFDEAMREQLEGLQWWRYAPWSLDAVPWERPAKALRLLQRMQRTGELLPYGDHELASTVS